MKKFVLLWVISFICFGWLNISSQSTSAKTVLSNILLIPGSKPVRLRLPGSDKYIEVAVIRLLPPGTEVAAENSPPFQVLCPNLEIIEVLSAKMPDCLKEASEQKVKFLAEVDPLWGAFPPPEGRGPDESEGELTELAKGTEKSILASNVDDVLKPFLLASLYATQKSYTRAIEQFENSLKTAKDPSFIRLLGYLYLQRAELGDLIKAWKYYNKALNLSLQVNDREGQAIAHHQMAFIHKKRAENDEAIQRAQKALELYREIGFSEIVQQIQELLQELQKS